MGWHLFSAMFLLGISYTLKNDAHVRVDIFYANLNVKRQAWINLIGFVIFILPISVLIIYNSVDFSYQAFLLSKQSGDPGSLPYRFIIKGVIPLSFILLVISGLIFARNNLKKLKPCNRTYYVFSHPNAINGWLSCGIYLYRRGSYFWRANPKAWIYLPLCLIAS
ncbi:MAG: TRAP dicarboxylate transporter, DctQ subunit, unknown substrate 6 [Candidatus Ruthia sp. Apha_13_S6]|nr:TRAP dicarboxylate transporter, DctQ subunit, unknown substrate 6 [Candidatus Ruthia sp. Apha_13_S6]